MKFIFAALAVLATSVLAAPNPDANASPWCTRIGQSCWKKRDADAMPWCTRIGQSCWKRDAAVEEKRWCLRPGQSCWKAKRAAEAFAEAIRTSGGLQARDAEADLSNLRGGAAFTAKRAVNELANIAATTDSNPLAYYLGLGLDNEFHADSDEKEKRDALPAPWCLRPGQSCWKNKRDANPEADADANAVTEDKRWCLRPGQSCWKAKRAAEAVLEAVGGDEDLDDKPFDPAYFAKRDAHPEPWCLRPGQSCWKAKRDVAAMRTVARSIVDSFN